MNPLLREFRIFWWRWALSEINPMDDGVGEIVMRLRQLLDERAGEPPSLAVRAWRWL